MEGTKWRRCERERRMMMGNEIHWRWRGIDSKIERWGGKRSKMICFHGQGLTTRDADMLLEGMSREEQREARQANLSHNDLDESPPALAHGLAGGSLDGWQHD